MKNLFITLLLIFSLVSLNYADSIEKVSIPLSITTGWLCNPNDPDFVEYRYYGAIPYCKRSVTEEEKEEIAKIYGIPKSEWHNYEFDHLIPLSIGGSDNYHNIWPQILSQSKVKDRIEDEVYLAMKRGKITQSQAVADILHWFCEPCKDIYGKDICTKRGIKIEGLDPTNCTIFENKYLQNLGFSSSDTIMDIQPKNFKIQDAEYEERPIPSKGYYYGAIVTTVYLPSDLDSLNFTGSTTLPNVSFGSMNLTTITFSDGNFVINLGSGSYLINAKKDTKIIINNVNNN
jgi:hypothetical protein